LTTNKEIWRQHKAPPGKHPRRKKGEGIGRAGNSKGSVINEDSLLEYKRDGETLKNTIIEGASGPGKS